MIVKHSPEIKEYLRSAFSYFSNSGDFILLIVDPYYGSTFKKEPKDYINNFIDFVHGFFSGLKSFGQSFKCAPMQNKLIEPIDLSIPRFFIHDRFIFLFDNLLKQYVVHIHLGGSINNIDLTGQRPLPITRISTFNKEELPSVQQIIT